MMHGIGLFIWEDGRKYEGEYLNDKKHGKGKFSWSDGRMYDGEWKEGVQHGVGAYTAEGRTRVARWENGRRVEWIDNQQ